MQRNEPSPTANVLLGLFVAVFAAGFAVLIAWLTYVPGDWPRTQAVVVRTAQGSAAEFTVQGMTYTTGRTYHSDMWGSHLTVAYNPANPFDAEESGYRRFVPYTLTPLFLLVSVLFLALTVCQPRLRASAVRRAS